MGNRLLSLVRKCEIKRSWNLEAISWMPRHSSKMKSLGKCGFPVKLSQALSFWVRCIDPKNPRRGQAPRRASAVGKRLDKSTCDLDRLEPPGTNIQRRFLQHTRFRDSCGVGWLDAPSLHLHRRPGHYPPKIQHHSLGCQVWNPNC